MEGLRVIASRHLLLDTCAILWLMNGERMSDESRKAIDVAQAESAVHVSPISAWEIATLAARGRIALTLAPEAWFAKLLRLPGIHLAPMPPEILMASAVLPGAPPRDPADRIIAATARSYGHTVVTRDGELIPFGRAGHIHVVAC